MSTGANNPKHAIDQARVVFQRQHKTAETPTYVAAEHALYWVDIEGQAIHRLRLDSSEHTCWPTPELVCGVVQHRSGSFVVGFPHALMVFEPHAGTFSELISFERGQPHNRINPTYSHHIKRISLCTP